MSSLIDMLPSFAYIVGGLWVTLQYTFVSVALGLVLGALLSLCKVSRNRYLNKFAAFYTSIFRGTPMLLQLAIAYYAVPGLIGYQIPAFVAGVMAFSLNSAAYVSEVIRAGIQAVDKGQVEAAKALGVPYRAMMKDIIFPQAFRNILPALVNELVDMLKESAIISTIGQADLMRRAQVVAAEHYSYFMPLMVAGLCYYFSVLILSKFAGLVERKMKLAWSRF